MELREQLSICLFCAILLATIPFSESFEVISSPAVTGIVGQDVVLPCQISTRTQPANMEVQWKKMIQAATETVYEYKTRTGQDVPGPNYQGRTVLLKDGFTSGNVSLKLKNVQPADGGTYNCIVKSNEWSADAATELQIAESSEENTEKIKAVLALGMIIIGIVYHLKKLQAELGRVQKEKDELQSELEKVQKGKEKLLAELKKVQKGKDKLQSELGSVKEEKDKLQASLGSVQQEKDKLQASLEKLQAELGKVKKGKAKFQASLGIVKEEKEKLQAELGSVQQEKDELQSELGIVKEEKEKLQAELGRVQQEKEKLQAELGWRRTHKYADDITLDTGTAHPNLSISGDKKSLKHEAQPQNVPSTPERFDSTVCMLGSEGVSTGKHYWEVDIGSSNDWDLGVARKSIERKGKLSLSPKEGFWALGLSGRDYWAKTDPWTRVMVQKKPKKIGVYLSYQERGEVTFFNVTDMSVLFTFNDCSFSGEVCPFFKNSHKETTMRICSIREDE